MLKRKLNNNYLLRLIIIVIPMLLSCSNPVSNDKIKINILLVSGLDYKCNYLYNENKHSLSCEGNGKNCNQELDKKNDTIPKLVQSIFENLKNRKYDFDANDVEDKMNCPKF